MSAPRRPRARPGSSPLSAEVRWYLASRGIAEPTTPPLIRTPEPRMVKGAQFDPARVDKAIKALRALRHTKGKWAGRPLDPAPWQVAYILAPIFGWVAPDPDSGQLVRIIRDVFIEVPRKNGKTTLVAGLAMVLAFADGEPGAEVLLGAASKDQASIAFQPLAATARSSKLLRDAGVKAFRSEIKQAASNSGVKVVSSRGDLAHGAHVHGALVDELHVHKDPALVEAIESGVGARSQPLVFKITTADDGQTVTVYAEQRALVEKLALKTLVAPHMYGVVFAAPETADRFAEETFAIANPSYPITPTRAFAKAAIDKAKTSPTAKASFERLHLGIRSSRDRRYFDLTRWDRGATRIVESDLAGRRAYGGLDLASTSDLCALSWLFPDEAGGFELLNRFWMPEAALPALDARTQRNASAWVKAGHITLTPGDVADYDFIKVQIEEDLEGFDVLGIGYDRWNSSQLVTDLVKAGAEMVKVGQGFASMSAPMKELNRLHRAGTVAKPLLRHNGNPVMRWMLDNCRAAVDPSGNVKPDKAKSMDKIDGVSATVTALAVALGAENEEPPGDSAYENRGMLAV